MDIFSVVKEAIDQWDPLGLLKGGAPNNEYDMESKKIAADIHPENNSFEIANIISKIFIKAFYESKIFSAENCLGIAGEIKLKLLIKSKTLHKEKDFYMTNRQKLLFMVQELHKRSFEKLRIIPSLAPSGLFWRCSFLYESKSPECIASNWLSDCENMYSQEEIAKMTPQTLADLFIQENADFIAHCKGENAEYIKWFAEMIEQLEEKELPFAFSDDFSFTDFWKTTKGKEIKILPNE
jgi:hypothetical protein